MWGHVIIIGRECGHFVFFFSGSEESEGRGVVHNGQLKL